jgi:hypothetical protein
MEGLHINAESRPHFPDKRYSTIGYGFDELIKPIKGNIANLYWLLSNNVIFNHISVKSGKIFTEYDNNYDELIIGESRYYKLACKDFIVKYAEFISPDYDEIFGFEEYPVIPKNEITTEVIEKKVKIYFRCTDAAFWEIFSNNTEIIEGIKMEFPKSWKCTLK